MIKIITILFFLLFVANEALKAAQKAGKFIYSFGLI